jgi:TonB family protein
MSQILLKLTSLLLFVFLLCATLNAQTKKTPLSQVIIEVQDQENLLKKCPQKGIRISHFCYDFCPVSLRRPLYSDEAKRMRITGVVRIGVIVNENGKVIYARVLEGKPLISQSARFAAYRSKFKPRKNCENKPIKFRGTIIYNFN